MGQPLLSPAPTHFPQVGTALLTHLTLELYFDVGGIGAASAKAHGPAHRKGSPAAKCHEHGHPDRTGSGSSNNRGHNTRTKPTWPARVAVHAGPALTRPGCLGRWTSVAGATASRFCLPLTFVLRSENHSAPTVGRVDGSTDWALTSDAIYGNPGGTGGYEPPHGNDLHTIVSPRPGFDALRHWDRLVASTAGTDVTQLSAWAEVRRQAGFTPIFVLAYRANQLVGGAMILRRRLPALGSIGYLPYGPVLHPDEGGTATLDAVCHALAHMARPHLRALFVQPPRAADSTSGRLLQLGFRASTAGIAPAASLELDLSRPADELHKSLSSGTRGSIRRATAIGVQARQADEHDLPLVAELLADTAAHHHFPPLPLPYLHTLYRQLDPGDHIKIFLAEHDGTPVAAQVLTTCGGVVKLRLTGMRRSTAAATGAAALLQWESILWAKAHGYHGFDFGGVATSTVDALGAGRTNLASRVNGRDYFKATFGGRPFRYPQPVELFSSRAGRIAYDFARTSKSGRQLIERAKHLMRAGGASR
jgi:hypothetical protein